MPGIRNPFVRVRAECFAIKACNPWNRKWGMIPRAPVFVPATTEIIRLRASPEDSGIMSNILHKNDIYCAVKFPLLVPKRGIKPLTQSYENQCRVIGLGKIWQGIA